MSRGVVLLVAATAVLAPRGAARAQSRFELRAGGLTVVSRRAAQFEGTVGTASGVLPGGELQLRYGWVGLAGRLFGGAFAADSGREAVGRVHTGDVRLLAGPRFLSADVGYARRAFSGAFGDRSWGLAHLGLRSVLPIGASGLAAELAVAYHAPLGGDDATGRASGRAAETRLVYTPGRLPVWLAVGYRHERFTVASTQDTRPEEVGGIVLAGGIRLGR